MPTFNEVLTIEDNPDLLKFTFEFDDMLIWPFIRFYIFNNIILPKTYNWSGNWATNQSSEKALRLSEIYHYAMDTIRQNPYWSHNKFFDCLMFTGQSTVKVEDKYFNRVIDFFALRDEACTLTIEDSFKWKYAKPRFFSNYCYHDYIHVMSYVQSKFKRVSPRDRETIDAFLVYLNEQFKSLPLEDTEIETIRNKLLLYSKVIKFYKYYYLKLFRKYNPRVVFVEDACFGIRCCIVKWARDQKIITVEPQHGMVSQNHPAYNYGQEIQASPAYAAYLPQYFLSYGKYWENLINLPVNKVTIGNPYYSENIKEMESRPETPGKVVILLISQPAVTDLIVNIALELSTRIDPEKFELKFRPHPLEWPFIKTRYPVVIDTDKIVVDTESNIYKSLRGADFVIGFNSTSLFEAIGLCRDVYVIEHSGNEQEIPRSLFKRFSSAEELLTLIESHHTGDKIDRPDIWASGWEDNYKRFMQTIL